MKPGVALVAGALASGGGGERLSPGQFAAPKRTMQSRWSATRKLARCVVRHDGAAAAELAGKRRTELPGKLPPRLSAAVRARLGQRRSSTLSAVERRGALAEYLLTPEPVRAQISSIAARAPRRLPDVTGAGGVAEEALADGVAAAVPSAAAAVLDTHAGSIKERAALAPLAALRACAPERGAIRLTRATLRAQIAAALYRHMAPAAGV